MKTIAKNTNTNKVTTSISKVEKALKNVNKEVKKLKNNSPFQPVTNVFSTTDYDSLTHVGANRPLKMHYKGILNSMSMFGNITVGLVAKVKNTYYILDGKHRFNACKVSGTIPFEFKLIELDNTNDIVRIMAALNSTGAKWSGENYLHGWVCENKKAYIKLDKVNKQFTNIPLGSLRTIFGIKTNEFNDGLWTGENFDKGLKLVKQINDIIPHMYETGKLNAQPLRALLHVMKLENYNHKKMLNIIKVGKGTWSMGEADLKIELLQEMSQF